MSKNIGELAEAKFITECLTRDLVISQPFGDNAKYDFIVDSKQGLKKVQIKSTLKLSLPYTDKRSGKVLKQKWHFNLASGSAQKIPYALSEVDIFALHIFETNSWLIIPNKEIFPRKTVSLIPDGNSRWNRYLNNWDALIL